MTNKRAVFSVLITIFLLFTPAVQAREKSLLKEIYAREACTILQSSDGEEIAGLARKGEALLVLRPAFSFISDTTNVRIYKVRTGKGIVGYVLPKYLTYDKEEAGRRYMAEKYDSSHSPISCSVDFLHDAAI